MAILERKIRREPHRFAKTPTCPVANDGVADLAGQREADPDRRPLCGIHLQAKRFAVPALTFAGANKIRATLEARDVCSGPSSLNPRVPHRATLPLHRRRDHAIGWYRPQAESRLRPLARRAAMTLRPPTVSIRARNPWRRLRTIFEGWYVRFTSSLHLDRCGMRRPRDRSRAEIAGFSESSRAKRIVPAAANLDGV